MTSTRNGAGDTRELEALGFARSGPEGDPDALWGRCPSCGLKALKVETTRTPYTARCLRCKHRHTFTQLLPESQPEKREAEEPWLMTWAEAEPEPEANWLLEGLLPADGISLLAAPPKVGKSTLGRCLAVAVAAGHTELLGRPLNRHGPVVLLSLEERPATVRGHLERLDADLERIYRVRPGQLPTPTDRLRKLQDAVKELQPALVIIDPVMRWLPVQDVSAYAEATNALTPLIGLTRKYRIHLMLIHHSRKSGGEHGQEILGSTAFTGSVDTFMSIRRRDNTRTIEAEGRDGVKLEETVLRLEEDGWVTAAGTRADTSEAALDARVVEYLEGRAEPASLDGVREGTKMGRTVASDALRRLEASGAVLVSGKGKRGNPFLYSIPTSIAGV